MMRSTWSRFVAWLETPEHKRDYDYFAARNPPHLVVRVETKLDPSWPKILFDRLEDYELILDNRMAHFLEVDPRGFMSLLNADLEFLNCNALRWARLVVASLDPRIPWKDMTGLDRLRALKVRNLQPSADYWSEFLRNRG